MGQITIRNREIKAGNNQSFEILAGDNDLIIGIGGDTSTSPGVSAVLVDGESAALIVADSQFSFVWAELWRIHMPHLGAAIVVGFTASDASNVMICVWKCTGILVDSPVRATGSAKDNSNDLVNVNVTSDPRDMVFYMGVKDSGTPAWTAVTAQTAEVANGVGADEPGVSPTASGTFGESGVDTALVAVGASLKSGRAGSFGAAIG